MLLLLCLVIAVGYVAAARHPPESISAYWAAAPTFIPEQTNGACDGPLIGNGDLGVAVSSSNNSLHFHIGLNQFWSLNSTEHTPAESRVRTVGGLSLHFLNQPTPLLFTGHQFIYNASLVLLMSSSSTGSNDANAVQYRVTATIHSRSNLLLLQLSSSTPTVESLVSLTTYTIGPFYTRSGSGSGGESSTAASPIVDFITRDSFYPNNSFPITAAVVTRALGQNTQLLNRSTTDSLSVTSTLSFTGSLDIAAVVWTNLDEAGLDQGAYDPPAPVTGVDPLPSALSASSALNSSALANAWQETAHDWQQFWLSTCVVHFPSTPALERYYYGAQYILKASTALGSVQPGLWGPWVLNDNMNWNGDYTYNYNAQAPTYGTYSSNQLDLAMAAYLPIIQYLPQARLNARQLHNCTTPLCYHFPVHVAPWGRSSVGGPQGDWRQQFIGTFVMMNLVTHCLYTEDESWCTRVYEIMKGAMEWWSYYLQREELARGGYRYVDPDDCSNEGCDGEKQYNGLLPLALIRRTLQWMIHTSTELDIDPDLRTQWTEQLNHLSLLPITAALPPYTNLTIFNLAEDNTTSSTPRPDGNPLAVYPIWPAELLSIHSPAESARIGLNTIHIYTGGWTQGNALPIFHPAAVRIGYPASDVLDGWMARLRECMLTNLYCYQGGGGIETSGATMAVNEMLMQSNEWAVNLFPVWPAQLSAVFEGMRARGNVMVSAAYNHSTSKVEGVEMWAAGQHEVTMRLMHPWQYTLEEKERRARQRLMGETPYTKGVGDVRPVTIVRLPSDGEDEGQGKEVVDVVRHVRPPQPRFAADVQYEQSEDVTWFEWVGCAGCRYRITEQISAQVEAAPRHRHTRGPME